MESERVKVLLVDDDEEDYLATRGLLSECGNGRFDLDWVATYNDALEAISRNEHNVYLIDYYLGERNGLELLRDVLTLGCRAPIILLTGQGDQAVDIEAMKAGAADYLAKSQINASLLERSIRYSIERSRVEEARITLEQQLRHSQKMEAIWQLAGGIAHDFNNLLTAILAYTQLGEAMTPSESGIRVHFQEIKKAAQRAADLTRQLLAFSRHQNTEQTMLNLNELILNTHKILRRLIGTDIELVTVAAPDLGHVRADPGQIEQVLINLAINARDAMPRGGKLAIETHNASYQEDQALRHSEVAPGEYVALIARDNGIGMTKEVAARVFEPFFTTKEQGKGTGLGLSTCYGIVKQNGGHITVWSEPGTGTAFTIYLPRATDQAAIGPHPGHSDLVPRGGEMVLVVEDEETVRSLAARILRQQGYTVLEAENGGEALKAVEEFADRDIDLDLLLTDMVMPLMGGRELAYRLRAKHTNTKVLYTSGYPDPAIIHQGPLGPSTDFIPKPFTPDELARRVREVLDTR